MQPGVEGPAGGPEVVPAATTAGQSAVQPSQPGQSPPTRARSWRPQPRASSAAPRPPPSSGPSSPPPARPRPECGEQKGRGAVRNASRPAPRTARPHEQASRRPTGASRRHSPLQLRNAVSRPKTKKAKKMSIIDRYRKTCVPRTSSLASLRPRSVTARISLMTLILAAASKPSSLRSNEVFSSLGASAAAAAEPGSEGCG